MGVLGGEAFLDFEGLVVTAVVTEEEAEGGAGFDAGDDAVGGGFAKEGDAVLFVAADADDADHHADEAREAGDGELLDADGHFRVGVLGVDFEDGFAVVAGGVALAGGGGVGVVDEGDEDGVHTAGVTAGEERVGVVGVGFEVGVAHADDAVGELLDLIADGLRDVDDALVGEEVVVRVVGGVEEILAVELTEDGAHEEVVPGHGIVGVGLRYVVPNFERAVVVEIVEVVVGLTDGGVEVERVGVRGLRRWVLLGGRGRGEEGDGEDGCGKLCELSSPHVWLPSRRRLERGRWE